MLFYRLLITFLVAAFSGSAAVGEPFPAQIEAIDPSAILRVSEAADVEPTRTDLTEQIFGRPTLDQTILPIKDYDYTDAVWSSKPNMGSIKAMHVDLPYGLKSRIWHFSPASARSPKCGFIVHAGHSQRSVKAPYQDVISRLVAIGCEVTAIDMPTEGLNDVPTIVNTPWGKFDVMRYGRPHANLQVTASATFNPLRFFVEPVIAVVNDYTVRGITNIGMFGLSGGGWTTDMAAALDPRIDLSYSLAGSMPVYMRSWVPPLDTGSLGDWEQMEVPHLGVDYMDLYVLGATGTGRRHVNLYIVNDDCCFGGYNANHFAPTVSAAVSAIGGSYAVAYDTTVSTHTVSAWTVNWVVNDVLANF